MLMKLVHFKLIAYPNKNQQNTCKASGQAREVDKEGTLESQEIPVGNEQIVSDHNVTVWGGITLVHQAMPIVTGSTYFFYIIGFYSSSA